MAKHEKRSVREAIKLEKKQRHSKEFSLDALDGGDFKPLLEGAFIGQHPVDTREEYVLYVTGPLSRARLTAELPYPQTQNDTAMDERIVYLRTPDSNQVTEYWGVIIPKKVANYLENQGMEVIKTPPMDDALAAGSDVDATTPRYRHQVGELDGILNGRHREREAPEKPESHVGSVALSGRAASPARHQGIQN